MSFYEYRWWKEAIGYEIYLKSFKDSNGDGIGDINGIREKLDYLKDLGITLIWLCPFYKSPMDDNGYDVSDYYDIDPSFGTLDDMKALIAEAHEKGIRIIADFVMNQTSDEHQWFIESRKSKDNPYRDYYIWADGRIMDGVEVEPTNWASFFGGSCWEKDQITGQYYMKIFSRKMPDLNWSNQKVRSSMQEIAKFWLDLGIDGFRVDAVAHIGRKEELVDSKMESSSKYKPDWRMFSNIPVLFDYLKEFNEKVWRKYDIMTVGEVGGGATPAEANRYAGFKNGSMNMVFNFDHNWHNNVWNMTSMDEEIVVNLVSLKEIFKKWQLGQYGKAWIPIYWLNHDQPRVMSQYGNSEKPYLSGSMLGQALYFMWGTPFVYQGEEIGMTNYPFKTVADFNDVSVKTTHDLEVKQGGQNEAEFIYFTGLRSRDNARTIMSWDDSKYAGFSTNKPWFNVCPDYQKVNVKKNLEDHKTIYKHYQKIFKLRKHKAFLKTLVYGTYKQLLSKHKHVYAYLRENDKMILTVCNFFDTTEKVSIRGFKVAKILLSNYEDSKTTLTSLTLRPYEAVTYLIEKR
jgi:glycosidase